MQTRKSLLKLALTLLTVIVRLNISIAQIGKEDLLDLDPVVFKTTMNSKLKGSVKGYAFYLIRNGNYVVADAGGVARTAEDNNGKVLPYTVNTLQEIASVSKMITAVAILRVLEKSAAVNVDSKIGPWLPKGWKPNPSFAALTFRQLLSHRSGLRKDPTITDASYEVAMEKYAMQSINPQLQKVSSYFNLNFQVFRVILPNIINEAYRQQDLAWTSQLNNKKITKAEYNNLISVFGSAIYRSYVMENLFKPAGITSPTCNPVGVSNLAWAYETKNSTKGAEGADHSLYCSSGFWQVSAKDLAVFMAKVMKTEDIINQVSKSIINNSANSHIVGWSYKLLRGNGYYYGHGGEINWGLPEVNSYLLYMPGNYIAYVQVNSREYHSKALRGLMYQAYDAARKAPYNCYNEGATYRFPEASKWGHISKVKLGTLNQYSGKSTGYSYYTQYKTPLKQDSSYTLTLNSGYTEKPGKVYWSVWIDYNSDGVFNDGEKILAKSSTSGIQVQAQIKIPISAKLGTTRMRVALKRHDSETIANACTSFSFGEIEDYKIEITRPCGILANLESVNITSTGASLRFDKPVDNVTFYVLRYQEVGTDTWTIVNPPITSPYPYISQDLYNLKPNTTYRWHVRSGCGDFSSYEAFKTSDVNVCGTDVYEGNMNSVNAKVINPGETKIALICSNGAGLDHDWFKFNIDSNTAAGTKIRIDLTSLPADYDLFLYKSNLSPIGSALKRGTTSEFIEKILSDGTYYIKVTGFNGAEHTHFYYQLSLKKLGLVATLRQSEQAEEENGITSPDVVVYPNPVTNGVLTIDYQKSFPEGIQPDVKLFNSMGNEAESRFTFNSEEGIIILNTKAEKGLYTLKVILGEKIIFKKVIIQ